MKTVSNYFTTEAATWLTDPNLRQIIDDAYKFPDSQEKTYRLSTAFAMPYNMTEASIRVLDAPFDKCVVSLVSRFWCLEDRTTFAPALYVAFPTLSVPEFTNAGHYSQELRDAFVKFCGTQGWWFAWSPVHRIVSNPPEARTDGAARTTRWAVLSAFVTLVSDLEANSERLRMFASIIDELDSGLIFSHETDVLNVVDALI